MPALDDAYLYDYAAGAGPAAVRLLTECQSVLNAQAHTCVQSAEAGYGGMLAGLPPAAMPADALQAVMLRAGEAQDEALDGIDPVTGLPRPLSPYLERTASGELDWSRRIGGSQEILLEAVSEENAEASLVRLMPGGGIPHHDHGGEELTLVLSGAFHDGHALYGPGDVCVAVPGKRHRPVVKGGTPCICLTVNMGQWKPLNPLYAVVEWLTRPRRRQH
ncbi:hypothetical protein GCM10007420_05640 [Glycocaulis albus]|uniref:ChrR-like cupin domain-containing protein n=1 Tax=Glycocaulis albus TaxID=1382801 RepID=A0ABQ1XH01_9PROT|nr:cupin domain-containing protein [Glycocaulis albus]GGG93044.1 hypothetical protein GCM10007420_05640 [Glycocaulis albus]